MKINFNKIKFIFIFFYVLLVLSILFLSDFFDFKEIGEYILILIFVILLVLIFIPIKYKKIGSYKNKSSKIIPIIIFSLMLAILVISINFTFSEFFEGKYEDVFSKILNKFYLLIIVLSVIWTIFAVAGILINIKKDLNIIYKNYLITVLSGSLLELLLTIPLHLIIVKRGKCLAGLTSIFGVIGGFIVLIFIMGPAIFLFLIFFYNKFSKSNNKAEAVNT